jgi:pimeloyl-ACP methyl ester carboxylesterase
MLKTVEIEGRTIGYRRVGDGPPMLLLHGGWSDSRDWRLQLEGLSDEFDIVAWDAPGCGRSSDPPAGFGMSDYADDVAALVEALGLDRPHVVGMSFGGGLALAVYERHPALARSLVLASAYAGWTGSLAAEEVAARLEGLRALIDLPPEQWVTSLLPSFFAGPVPPTIIDDVVAVMCDARPAGIAPMIEAFATADLRHVLPSIEVPTLLLYGDADTRAPLSVAEAMRAAIPRSKLAVFPGVGHCSNLEAPIAFNDRIRRFLRSVDT